MKTKHSIIVVGALALAGCRNPGLPPEAPEHDAANPEAQASPVEGEAQADPFTRSAFEGESLDAGGHQHHHHGHAKPKAAKPKAAPATDPASDGEAQGHDEHAGHGGGGRS